MTLHQWNGLLWQLAPGGPFAYCPEHRMRLEIISRSGHPYGQESSVMTPHAGLICPVDDKQFPVPNGSFWTLQSRFIAAKESVDLKGADIIDLDGVLTPIVKVTTPTKDEEYWAEVRINDSRKGKQLVVYAGRRGARDKAQIFIDPENEKVSFDQNNIHPNDIFTKLTADFDSGKRTTLEQ